MSMIRSDWMFSEADQEFYRQNGYRTYDHFLTDEALACCQREIDVMLSELQPGRDPADIISPHCIKRWIWDLANEPCILDAMESQIGANIVLWSTHMLCKPPGSGIEIPWHQDAPYWNVGGPLPAGLWIAFDAMDEDNGAMVVLPGWHRKGTLPIDAREDALFDQMIAPQALPPDVDSATCQYRMPAGGAGLHDTMLPHYSTPNQSRRWRRVLVLRYMSAEGDMGEKMYEDYRDGSPMPREYFLVRGDDVLQRGLPRAPGSFR
ncbi:MAG: hypothetical protein CMJ81_20960 [Planctomycetaceae bacterium]|nr:hypothetical protein [Planctomycetaceae bacterium]MBP62897.1 hypothetical protein [Planctomycetaceae bacterium]